MIAVTEQRLVIYLFALLSVAGFSFSLYNVRDAQRDIGALRAVGRNSLAARIARWFFWSELLRTLQLFMFLVLAVSALINPDTPPDAHVSRTYQQVTTWLFIVFTVMLVTNAALSFGIRRQVLHTKPST